MNAKVIAYGTVRAKVEEIAQAVAYHIKEGWQPYGSPSFVQMGNPKYVQWIEGVQAVVKYEPVWTPEPAKCQHDFRQTQREDAGGVVIIETCVRCGFREEIRK